MKIFFAILVSVLSISGVANAVEAYPIPADVQDFYRNINSDSKTNCVNTELFEDQIYGPNLALTFYKDGVNVLPTWQEVYFSNFEVYGERFKTTFKISKKAGSEILDIVHYEDACIPRYPFGEGCRPVGVRRHTVQIVKDAHTGWVTSASLKEARNGLNVFGNLKGRWNDRGLYQYSCKEGVLTVDIKKALF